ncbi:MAG: hypothetical protein KatS3mg008_1660 [Acidimicrobiales bacterium]|nr:MAG: hypothetical protein KatS3mg008_1660 [Acidimicrobiales bacterium]
MRAADSIGRRIRTSATLVVTLLAGLALTVVPASATEGPMFWVGDVSIDEPSDAARPLLVRVPVTLSDPARAPITFAWRVSGGTATPGVDYISPFDFRTFTIGERSATQRVGYIPIKILDDDELEGEEEPETIEIEIFAWDAPGLLAMKRFATITIEDDLDFSGVEGFERGLLIGEVSALEGIGGGATSVYVPVVIDRPLDRDVRFTWQMLPGFSSADASDLRVTTGRGIIRAGQSVGGFAVAIKAGLVGEGPESVALTVIPDDQTIVNWGGLGFLRIVDVTPT